MRGVFYTEMMVEKMRRQGGPSHGEAGSGDRRTVRPSDSVRRRGWRTVLLHVAYGHSGAVLRGHRPHTVGADRLLSDRGARHHLGSRTCRTAAAGTSARGNELRCSGGQRAGGYRGGNRPCLGAARGGSGVLLRIGGAFWVLRAGGSSSFGRPPFGRRIPTATRSTWTRRFWWPWRCTSCSAA